MLSRLFFTCRRVNDDRPRDRLGQVRLISAADRHRWVSWDRRAVGYRMVGVNCQLVVFDRYRYHWGTSGHHSHRCRQVTGQFPARWHLVWYRDRFIRVAVQGRGVDHLALGIAVLNRCRLLVWQVAYHQWLSGRHVAIMARDCHTRYLFNIRRVARYDWDHHGVQDRVSPVTIGHGARHLIDHRAPGTGPGLVDRLWRLARLLDHDVAGLRTGQVVMAHTRRVVRRWVVWQGVIGRL